MGKERDDRRVPRSDVIRMVFGVCSYDSNAMKSKNPHSGFYIAETTRTLDNNGGNPACKQGGVLIVEVYDARGNGGAKRAQQSQATIRAE